MLLAIIRFPLLICIIFCYLFSSLIIEFIFSGYKRLRIHTLKSSLTAKLLLLFFNGKIDSDISPKVKLDKQNYLFLSNHLSYMDIIIISSKIPALYLTSKDVVSDILSRSIVRAAGTLIIDRRTPVQLFKEIENVSNILQAGLHLVIFPEGRASNGECVGGFKAPLVEAAIKAKKNIIPVCIQYLTINGQPFQSKNRDLICFYGDMQFIQHLLKLLTIQSFTAKISILDELELNECSDRKKITNICHEKIQNRFNCS